MSNVRLMDTPEDYKKLGVNPDQIEMWEEQRRSDDSEGSWEWWYFDGIMDDKTKIVIQFFTKTNEAIRGNVGAPNLAIKITMPDGKHYEEHPHFPVETAVYGKGKCDVHFGNNKFVGDFNHYEIHVDETNGIGADLKIQSHAKPYRPGTAYFEIGDKYYTWLCAMPKGTADGTITINGETIPVHGGCYHDHQWGTMNLLQIWNHWLWSRQSFDDCSIMVFDMISQKKLGGERFPIVFIQDKDGNIIFENHKDVKYDLIDTYKDEESGKVYPGSCRYTFEKDGREVVYSIRKSEILENRSMGKEVPFAKKLAMKAMGLDPSYVRYAGEASLQMKEHGNSIIDDTGDLIYEFMYPASTDFRKLQ
ncbi:MAG: lipocalin-like domain-containing protein [Eubacteriales bacterium]|nr:lipocalin-like domain-containing protein [Eubacteriales bacterium]